jgi:hypothetical protein
VSKLIIRKRVELDFLGEEYKEAYLVFRSIPVSKYDTILGEIKGADDNQKANAVILKILKEFYIEGKFPDDDGNLADLDGAEELDGLDKDSLLECFGKITGVDIQAVAQNPEAGLVVDPKSDTPSKRGSTAEKTPPEKS